MPTVPHRIGTDESPPRNTRADSAASGRITPPTVRHRVESPHRQCGIGSNRPTDSAASDRVAPPTVRHRVALPTVRHRIESPHRQYGIESPYRQCGIKPPYRQCGIGSSRSSYRQCDYEQQNRNTEYACDKLNTTIGIYPFYRYRHAIGHARAGAVAGYSVGASLICRAGRPKAKRPPSIACGFGGGECLTLGSAGCRILESQSPIGAEFQNIHVHLRWGSVARAINLIGCFLWVGRSGIGPQPPELDAFAWPLSQPGRGGLPLGLRGH